MAMTTIVVVEGVEQAAGRLIAYTGPETDRSIRGDDSKGIQAPFGPYRGKRLYDLLLYGNDAGEEVKFRFHDLILDRWAPIVETVAFSVNGRLADIMSPFVLTGSWDVPLSSTAPSPPTPPPAIPAFCATDRLVEGIGVQVAAPVGGTTLALAPALTPSIESQPSGLRHRRFINGLYRHAPGASGKVGVFVQGVRYLEQSQIVPVENATRVQAVLRTPSAWVDRLRVRPSSQLAAGHPVSRVPPSTAPHAHTDSQPHRQPQPGPKPGCTPQSQL